MSLLAPFWFLLAGAAAVPLLLHLLRRLDAAVAMRFHAAVFALTQKVPLIGVDYFTGAGKVSELLADQGADVIKLEDPGSGRGDGFCSCGKCPSLESNSVQEVEPVGAAHGRDAAVRRTRRIAAGGRSCTCMLLPVRPQRQPAPACAS